VRLREQAEKYLGTNISKREWDSAKARAERKLRTIISREGDAGGCRRDPRYLAQLIAEAVRESRFSGYTFSLMEMITALETKEKPAAKATSNSITSVSIVADCI